MPEAESQDWKDRWNLFLGTGSFDEIPHPESGYKIDDLVSGRDGITYLVKGINKNGQIILGLDREPKGQEKKTDISDIRLLSTVGAALIRTGIIQISEGRREEISAPKNYPPAYSERN